MPHQESLANAACADICERAREHADPTVRGKGGVGLQIAPGNDRLMTSGLRFQVTERGQRVRSSSTVLQKISHVTTQS